MTFNSSGFKITARVVVLTVLIIAAVVSYYETDLVVTPIMLSLIALISAVELIWYLGRTERDFTRFLLSIKHHDFSRAYRNQPQYKELQNAYDLITKSFEDLETQKHAENRLLQIVSEHLKIGLVCYDPAGEVVFVNKAFREMLDLESLARLESISQSHPSVYEYLIAEKTVSGALVKDLHEEKLLIKTEAFSLRGEQYKLASLYDIRSTLDTNELESYQKLMRVMTHEIMNSATPVLSLIQVVNKKLVEGDRIRSLSESEQKNIAFSLGAIETQTSSILRFVEAYRKINKEIRPNKEVTTISTLFDPVIKLLIDPGAIDFYFENQVDEGIRVDTGLMSQTLINLLKNAIEAVNGVNHPQIRISVNKSRELLKVTVDDNGVGIDESQRSQVFVPFFTTKTEGSGVGLALSRKIINAHGGNLICEQTAQKMTRFSILLPKEVFQVDEEGSVN